MAATVELALDEEIIRRTIALRQQQKLSLADAIIAATALEYGVALVTRNEADFKRVSGLTVINPFTVQPPPVT
ncbi:MAG: twitching motility protein PilT [Prosthecobacter sp.]|nr:twitching motility protein PilT [Prosthecobacter sp.]